MKKKNYNISLLFSFIFFRYDDSLTILTWWFPQDIIVNYSLRTKMTNVATYERCTLSLTFLYRNERVLFPAWPMSDCTTVWIQDLFLERISLFRRVRRRGFSALGLDVIIRSSVRLPAWFSNRRRWRIDYGLSRSARYLSRCLVNTRWPGVACN